MTLDVLAPPPAVDSRAALHRLLDESLAHGPEFEIGMANHLPMALAALEGLGADEARMRAFRDHYARRLQPAPASASAAEAAALADWWPLRGRMDAFGLLRAFFARALAREGVDAVLRDALPALADGTSGAAMHGPIRVAHALESAHEGELATALAYWAARWVPLPTPRPAMRRIEGAAAWFEALDARRVAFDPAWQSTAPLISARMLQAASTPPFLELAGALATDGIAPEVLLLDLAKAAAARYAQGRNFTVLHVVTASRALRVLARWLPARPEALAPLLHAVAAAILCGHVTTRPPVVAGPPRDWAEVRRHALASDDDHVVKLVHAAAMLQAEAPDVVWLAAARAAVATSRLP